MSSRSLIRAGLAGFAALNLLYFVVHAVETVRFLLGGESHEEAETNPAPPEPLGPAIWLAQAIATLSFACLAIATLGVIRRR